MQVEVASRVLGAPPPRRVHAVLSRAARMIPRSKVQNPRSRIEISVFFCGETKMRSLNRRFRRKDRSTDVLAFPGSADGFLGDIVVCVPYATRQARRRGEPAAREIDRLLLHGFLHLSGYDHETDQGQMDALEAKLTRRIGISDAP